MFLVETEQKEDHTDIIVISRDEKGVKYYKRVSDFRPYFYVPADDEVPDDYRITGVEKGYTSILGEPLKKIYVRKSNMVSELRDKFSNHYEADILFSQRYIIDKIGEVEPYPLKVLFLDIELNTGETLPNLSDPDQEVICISLEDTFDNKKTTLFYESPDAPEKLSGNENIKVFNSEVDLLNGFINYMNKYDPDVISGWNCLDEHTHIQTRDGLKTLKDVKIGDILSNGDKVRNKWFSKKRVRELGSNFGIIRTSDEHKFLVFDTKYKYKNLDVLKKDNGKFKKAKDIKKGFLKFKYDWNKNTEYNIKDEILYLLGIIYSDGTMGKHSVSVYNNNLNIITKIRDIRSSLFPEENSKICEDTRHQNITYRITFKKKNLKNHLPFIINNQGKKELNIPLLSKLSDRQFGIFCAGLIDGDGSKSLIQVNKNSSYEEINGFHNLLLMNGILGSRYKCKGIYGNRFHILSIENESTLTEIRKHVVNHYKVENILMSNKKNRETHMPKFFIDREKKEIYTYISENRKLNEYCNMVDIETDSHIFLTPFITHNCERFDLTYLIKRMKKLGVDYRKLSPLNFVAIDKRYDDVFIKGRIILDLMRAYEHYRRISNQGHAESYSLEFTAQDVLGYGKLQIKEGFHDLWVNKPEQLIEYNVRDVNLVKAINEKLDIINFFNTIRCKACAQLKDIYFSSVLIDGLLLKRCHGNRVLPKRNVLGGTKYSGAYVVLPTPGLYENVLALDIKAMYPNIIKTFNMGYETFNPAGEIKISDEIGFNKGIGIISKTVRDLEKEREYYKKLMKEAYQKNDVEKGMVYHYKQYSIKVLSNAIYGYIGFPKSRLYLKDVANAITTMGRKLIKWTHKVLENIGYKIIYGDTDSVYVVSKKEGFYDILKEGRALTEIINKSYVEFVKSFGVDECTLEIEFEKVFKRVLFVSKRGEKSGAKKKYAYIPLWVDGKIAKDEIEYAGFETVRSDSPRISREIQRTVLKMILQGKTKDDVIEYLKDKYDKIINRLVPDEEVGFPTRIKESLLKYKSKGPVIKGALYSNKYLGTRFGQGSKPKFIYIKNVPRGYPDTEVLAYEKHIPEGFIPDWDKVTKRIFQMKLDEIFKSVGWGEVPNLQDRHTHLSKWGIK